MLKNMDALFGASIEVIEINPDELKSYHDHRFASYSEEKILGMLGSVEQFGLIHPVVARTYQDGYEILAGHNRAEACRRVNRTVPTIVHVGMDDATAHAYVVDSNLWQRGFSELPLSVQADVIADYRIRFIRQGWRKDLFSESSDEELLSADDVVSDRYNISRSEIARLVRLNSLTDDFKKKLDQGEISKRVGVELSFLDQDNQNTVHYYISQNKNKITMSHAHDIRRLATNYELNEGTLHLLLNPVKSFEEAYHNVEVAIHEELGNKVKVKEKSITFNFKNRTEFIELLNKMNLRDVTNLISSGDEVK